MVSAEDSVDGTGTVVLLQQGDITTVAVDAIVNAANSGLLGGGGVDGAIHHAGGPAILAACKELRATRYPKGLPTGQAVATTAGRLPARWVIHTVGPIYRGQGDEPQLLADAYRNSLAVASQLGVRTIAFPAISTGVYCYPLAEAAAIAIRELAAAPPGLEPRMVLFSREALAAHEYAARTAGIRYELR